MKRILATTPKPIKIATKSKSRGIDKKSNSLTRVGKKQSLSSLKKTT